MILLALVVALEVAANAAPVDAGVVATDGGVALTFQHGFQAAIDSTPNGGTVVLRPGVYGEVVSIKNRRDLKIVARGGPAVLLHQAVDWYGWQSGSIPKPLLVIEDSSNILLENIYVRRDVQRERDPFRATTAQVMGSKGVALRHVFIGTGDGKALEIGNSDVTIEDSTLEAVQYSVAVARSKLTITGSSLVAQQVPIAVFGQGCAPSPTPSLTISRSLLSGGIGLAMCPDDYARLRDNIVVGRFFNWTDMPNAVAEAKQKNTLLEASDPLPSVKGLNRWRPPDELLRRHLEEFAVLPPITTGTPKVGTEWFVCSRTGATDWRLFPDGPTTAMTLPIPLPLPWCDELSERPAEGAPVKLLERRGKWLKLRPDKAYIETGPHRVQQGFWVHEDYVATPCTLVSGGVRLWTPLWSAGPVEAIDARRVSIRGATDYCGLETKTMNVEVPPSLQPATARAFKLECTMKRNAQACGQ